jgi:signal transduction histidine kinase
MENPVQGTRPLTAADYRLLAYVADLEEEVDRLRRHNRHLYQEARTAVDRLQRDDASPDDVKKTAEELAAAVEDLRELPGYHPSHDQVVALAVRPLAQQVFRWQRRLQGAERVELRLDLDADYVEWFPARLRHILDNLVSNALRYRDDAKAESWVRVGLRLAPEAYELKVSDNGLGIPPAELKRLFELMHRATLARAGDFGVGLAVVKVLVEQSGGTLNVDSGAGQGSTFTAVLPRYTISDYLA